METQELTHTRNETAVVEQWRYDQLVRAGVEPPVAALISASPHIDLHRACLLAQRGCSSQLLAQILL